MTIGTPRIKMPVTRSTQGTRKPSAKEASKPEAPQTSQKTAADGCQRCFLRLEKHTGHTCETRQGSRSCRYCLQVRHKCKPVCWGKINDLDTYSPLNSSPKRYILLLLLLWKMQEKRGRRQSTLFARWSGYELADSGQKKEREMSSFSVNCRLPLNLCPTQWQIEKGSINWAYLCRMMRFDFVEMG